MSLVILLANEEKTEKIEKILLSGKDEHHFHSMGGN